MNKRRTYLAAGWGVVGITAFTVVYAILHGGHASDDLHAMLPFIIGSAVLLVVLVAYQVASRRKSSS